MFVASLTVFVAQDRLFCAILNVPMSPEVRICLCGVVTVFVEGYDGVCGLFHGVCGAGLLIRVCLWGCECASVSYSSFNLLV